MPEIHGPVLPPKLKPGDYVRWEECGDNSAVWVVLGPHRSEPNYFHLQMVECGKDFVSRFSPNPFLLEGTHLQPIPLPDKPLFLYKLIPARKNWRFTGFESIIVVADSPASALKIGPDGVVQHWPQEGWADDYLYVLAFKLGPAEPYLKENTVILTSYHNEGYTEE